MESPQFHHYIPNEQRYSFLCSSCPLNTETPYNAAVGAMRVDVGESELNDTGFIKPKSKLGVAIRACRRMRQTDECTDMEAPTGMYAAMVDRVPGGRFNYEWSFPTGSRQEILEGDQALATDALQCFIQQGSDISALAAICVERMSPEQRQVLTDTVIQRFDGETLTAGMELRQTWVKSLAESTSLLKAMSDPPPEDTSLLYLGGAYVEM